MGDESLIVLDTHVLVWWLADALKLSTAAKKAIQAGAAKSEVLISAATILEIATLVRRQRLVLTTGFDEWLADLRELPELQIVPVNADIAARAGSFGTEVHGDPIDRLIIATALVSKAKLVSADATIRASRIVPTVW